MRILAYADRLSGRPGEAVEIKVSCEELPRYEAELVRIIQGDINPQGPGYREDAVGLDLGGPFEGRFSPFIRVLTALSKTTRRSELFPHSRCLRLSGRRCRVTGRRRSSRDVIP